MIDMSGRKWGQLLNMGEPFNSPQDDLGLVLQDDGHRGYLSSSRNGGFGQDDIYMFYAPGGLRGMTPTPILSGIVRVTDRATSRRLAGASIRLFALNDEGLIDDEAAYELELVPGEAEEMAMKLIRKKEEELGEPLAVTDRSGEAVLELEPEREYLLLVSKPDFFTQELRFRTDEQGPDQPLDILAEPIDCILLSGTVLSDRFEIPVPGATVELFNACSDEKTITRTNIRGEYEFCLPIGCDYSLKGSKAGYEAGETTVTTVRLRGSRSLNADIYIHPTSDAILREPIREGTIIVLDDIYYDFNKSAIRKGAASDLDALAKLMQQYPSMQIELGAHTDSRGTTAYNLDLSNKRAASAKAFLVQRGIAGERIRTVGYGESQPP
jgi:outer membrane protein OmpA-like peptidoglycan-associated protein